MADPSLQPYKNGYYLWKYVPSLAAAVVFCLLFVGVTAAHCFRLWRSRLWYCIWFAVGGLMEIIGYIARSDARSNTGKLPSFIVQNTLLLLPPVLFAATVYMVLGRIICSVKAEKISLVRVDWLTTIFVLGDVFAFVVQGSGAGLMVTASQSALGGNIIVAGLLIQVVMFGLFCLTAAVFHYRYQSRYAGAATRDNATEWKQSLYMLYGISLLIMVRSVFRVVEFSLGQDGYPLTHEWTLYVFDSTLMFAAMVIFFLWHPSRLQQGQEKVRGSISPDPAQEVLSVGLDPWVPKK